MKLSLCILTMGAFLGLHAAEPVLVDTTAPTSAPILVDKSEMLTVEARKQRMRSKNDISRVTRQISFETHHIGRPEFDGVIIALQNKQKAEKRDN